MMWANAAKEAQYEGLVQERRNSIANALELRLSCTNSSNGTFLKRPLVRVVLYKKWYLIWEDLPVALAQEWWFKIILNMRDKHVLLHREGFQLSTPSQCWKKKRNANISLCFQYYRMLCGERLPTKLTRSLSRWVEIFIFNFFFTSCFSLHHDLSALSFFSHTLFWWVILLETYLQCMSYGVMSL